MTPSPFPIVVVGEINHPRYRGYCLPQNIELLPLHFDPGVQRNAGNVSFGASNIVNKSGGDGWDQCNNRDRVRFFCDLRYELIVQPDRDHVRLCSDHITCEFCIIRQTSNDIPVYDQVFAFGETKLLQTIQKTHPTR